MEEDAARLLLKVVKTITIVIIWLMLSMVIGIYFGWMFFYKSPTLGNFICYGFVAGTFVLMIIYLYRLWKEDIGS